MVSIYINQVSLVLHNIMSSSKTGQPTFTADPQNVLLCLESKRFRYAFMYDPLLAMSASKVDPLPHQIEAVYKHLLKKPQIRFMLAHDPGAGKTIMAGLVIKELKLRGLISRILIVVPGQLQEQWKWEMYDKFDEQFTIIRRDYVKQNGLSKTWNESQIITSMDFAKRDDILTSLDNADFDLIVVDEAHKMSAYSTGRTTTKTARYRLGEKISISSRHLLFLTATPHKGDPNNFRLLLDLLEPGYFASDEMISESVQNKSNPLFLRRSKEGMTDFDGRPLFVPRVVSTPDVRMSPQERTLYAALSNYVKEQYNLALRSAKRHNITFALIILQRRSASSTYALHRSLMRRRAKLEDLQKGIGKITKESGKDAIQKIEKIDELSETERWDEEKQWELITVAQNKDELRQEIDIITGLIEKAERVMMAKTETKLVQLKNTLHTLNESHPGEKILIFTEAKDTLDYLVSNIEQWGYDVNTIHGSMQPHARKDAEKIFRDKTQIMVATEAAGEGINLQFCHIMINYDLPWNPNRLEQRMGRIHRYGQTDTVQVFNMVASDTREGEIMQTLFNKLIEIKSEMGSDKVFDVISDIVPGKSLSQMLLDATVRSRTQSSIVGELRKTIDSDRERLQEYLQDSLATKYIDTTILDKQRESARERQLIPEYTQYIFDSIIRRAGGNIKRSVNGTVHVTCPPDVTQDRTEKSMTVTFDKRQQMVNPGTDLVTFGHPVFDQTLQWAEQQYSDASMNGSVFTDKTGSLDGYITFYKGHITDGAGRVAGSRMVAIYGDTHNDAREVPASILLDLEPGGDSHDMPDYAGVQRACQAKVVEILDTYAGTIQLGRDDQAESSRRYGIKSIDILLSRISDDIVQLLYKKAAGKKVDLAIYNKRQDRKKYRTARQSLKARIAQDCRLIRSEPTMIGIIRVVPKKTDTVSAHDKLIKSIMDMERQSGYDPSDTRGSGYGFDIRSVPENGSAENGKAFRYMLAKVSGDGKTVTLTTNEWLRARMLAEDYYLCVDMDNAVKIVQNPANTLDAVLISSGYSLDITGY